MPLWVVIDTHFLVYLDEEDVRGEKRSQEHTILRQPTQPIHKPCLGLHKEREDRKDEDAVEGKTRGETRKVIVRSAYFKNKQAEKNNYDKKQDCSDKADVAIGEHKKIIDSALCNNRMKNNALKRKISPNDSVQSVRFFHLETLVFFRSSFYFIHVVMVSTPPGKPAAQGHAFCLASSW